MLRLKKILCPVDFFPASELAALYAAQLTALYDARMKLIHIVSSVVPTVYDFSMDPAMMDALRQDSEKQLQKLLSRLPDSQLKVDTEIRTGDIALQIERSISAFKPDLLVMGSHGNRGFERWILGSVTTRMLRRSPIPVMTISSLGKRRAAAPPIRRILATTDFSKDSEKTLEWAFSIAQAAQARVTLMHVIEEVRALTSAQYRAGLVRDYTRKIEKLVPAGVRDWSDVATSVVAGTPYFEILSRIKKEKIDLVIMNTQGKGLVERALLGSTTDRVVRAAECAVLLIPPRT